MVGAPRGHLASPNSASHCQKPFPRGVGTSSEGVSTCAAVLCSPVVVADVER